LRGEDDAMWEVARAVDGSPPLARIGRRHEDVRPERPRFTFARAERTPRQGPPGRRGSAYLRSRGEDARPRETRLRRSGSPPLARRALDLVPSQLDGVRLTSARAERR
jgi:hypothetical protein